MKVNLCGLRQLYPQVIAVTQQTIGNLLFFQTMMTAALTLLLVSTVLVASAVRHVPAGQVHSLYRRGKLVRVLQQGTHLVLPLLDRVAHKINLAGQTLRLADLKGKPVVVNFWASWCDPCVDEAPVLEAASQQYAAQGVIFVGVSYEDEPSDSTRFLQQYGVTYPVGTDGSAKTPGAIAIAYGVLAPPETYFINRSGVVVDEFSGPLSANLLDQRVARILP